MAAPAESLAVDRPHATLATPTAATGRAVKIAVVSYGLPRPGFKRGGIERVAHDLSEGLARRGHDVTVFSHDPLPPHATYKVLPLPWRQFVETWAGRRLTMGYLGHVLSALPPFGDAEVVIAHGDSLLLPLRRRPVIRVMHGSALEEARTATSVGRRVLQLGVYGLELLTALTPQRCVGVSQNTTLSNPLVKRVIPNGVDLTVFHPDAAERSDRPIIVFVGALTGRKRGAWLVREFVDHIKPHVPDAELHMVSHSGETVPGVVFHTGLADAELAALYRRAWVYASPSTYEGFGLPYVEAMACGVPVVATPNPGSLEVLGGGQYGRVVDDAVFSETVVHLLRDQQVRTSLVRTGLARAADYDLERTLDEYERLVRALVTAHG